MTQVHVIGLQACFAKPSISEVCGRLQADICPGISVCQAAIDDSRLSRRKEPLVQGSAGTPCGPDGTPMSVPRLRSRPPATAPAPFSGGRTPTPAPLPLEGAACFTPLGTHPHVDQ